MIRLITAIIILAAIGGLVGLISTVPKGGSQGKGYNVIIFAFDGLQAKHLHAYGYPLSTTPNIDSFLQESTLFKNTVSAAPWTVPSFMSMFTSLYPSEHKLVNKLIEERTSTSSTLIKANLKKLNPNAVTLAEIFKRNGYATGGFTGDAGVSAAFGYGQGFDTYYDKETFGGLDLSAPQALTWLTQNKDKKFFMFVHGYDVHGQHTPKEGYDYRYVTKPYTGIYTGSTAEQAALREKGLAGGNLALTPEDIAFWRAIYDEKINDADKEFGDFLVQVQNLNLLDNTIVVLVSDHGTEFYEHKKFDHGHTLYNELLNTLFAIHVPGQKDAKVVTSLVSTMDIAPTLLSILDLKDPAVVQMKGADLTPSFKGTEVSHDVYSETDYRLYTHKRSITTVDGWKFILTRDSGVKELYNLSTDPAEQTNLMDKEPKTAYALEQKLLQHLKEVSDTGPWTIGCAPVYSDQCATPPKS